MYFSTNDSMFDYIITIKLVIILTLSKQTFGKLEKVLYIYPKYDCMADNIKMTPEEREAERNGSITLKWMAEIISLFTSILIDFALGTERESHSEQLKTFYRLRIYYNKLQESKED